MDWLLVGAYVHAYFVVGLSVVTFIRYLLSPRRWHIAGMAVAFIILTLNNVDTVTTGVYPPASPRFNASLVSWIIGDVCLLLLLGRARSELDRWRRRR